MSLTKDQWLGRREEGLTEDDSRQLLCPHWLLGAEMGMLHRLSCVFTTDPFGGWLDHVSGWRMDGEPRILLAEPYQLSGRDIAELDLVRQLGLEVVVHTLGFYGYGTLAVEVEAL